MKITKSQLIQIIKEEKQKVISEQLADSDQNTLKDIIEELKAAVKMHTSQHERLQSMLDKLSKED